MTAPNFLFYGLAFANIDRMVVLGLIMPTWIGLFFVLAKPQIGIGVAIFWAFESYRLGKLRQMARDFVPVSLAILISLWIYGPWPL